MRHMSGEINQGFAMSEAARIPIDAMQVGAGNMLGAPHPQGARHSHGPGRVVRKARTVVLVENANKIYGSGAKARQVLRDLSMAVEEHTIYGLLGASGCGKTTILTCIVALRKLDSGSILVCGEPTGTAKSGIPGKKVGYMPQEIALNGEFTIVEVLAYFGRIYGMSASDIKNRTKYLVMLLSLRGLGQQIQNLSDGQKRRVSLAVSLIHEPDLLVLDEPTVGCDPLLRESIWSYLHDLVAQKSATVIVTTHYIEEMRQADRIGIMRNGRLLCEDSPSNLLQIYNETLLDNVVVKLCQADEGPGGAARGGGVLSPYAPNHANGVDVIRLDTLPAGLRGGTGRSISMVGNVMLEWSGQKTKEASTTSVFHRMHGLLAKDLTVVVRNWWFSLVLALLPALTVALFCVAVDSSPNDLSVGVVNYERDTECPRALQFGREPTANGSLGSGATCSEAPSDLACAYIEMLNKKAIKLVWYETEEDAEEDALNGNIWGYFWFGDQFSQHFYKRIVLRDVTDNETLLESRVNVRLDATGFETARFLQNEFMQAFQKLSASIFSTCGVDAAAREMPVKFGQPIFAFGDNKEPDPKGFMATGATVGFLFFMCALQCGLTYIIEKKDGMLARTLVTGVAKIEIMASHFVVQLFIVALAQVLVCFFVVFVMFGTESRGSILLGFALVLISCVAGMSLGFLLASFCSDEKYAMLMALGLVFPNYLLAGIMWPTERLPEVLQYASQGLPCTITVVGLRAIVSRGMGIGDEMVWMGFATSGGWIVLYWTIVVLYHKYGQPKQ